MGIGSYIKHGLLRAGWDLVRLPNSNSEFGTALRLIRASGASAVVDVGANTGQYATEILATTRQIRVISFEPLQQAHELLVQRARQEPRWIIAERMALGTEEGTINLNVAGNFVSSSILPMHDTHRAAAPQSVYTGTQKVAIRRLDSAVKPHCSRDDVLYLKIDTQGYESQVMAGATGVMDQIGAIQLELSFVELYEGQLLAFDMMKRIQNLGYKLFGIAPEFRDTKSGELLQANGYFLKQSIRPGQP